MTPSGRRREVVNQNDPLDDLAGQYDPQSAFLHITACVKTNRPLSHSGLMPTRAATARHFSMSARMRSRTSSGVLVSASTACTASAFLTVGLDQAAASSGAILRTPSMLTPRPARPARCSCRMGRPAGS